MTNLIQIYEDLEKESQEEEEDDISSSSDDDPIQTTPSIMNEVMATMAIGSQLNVNFRPNDGSILKKMVVRENKERALLFRRVNGN